MNDQTIHDELYTIVHQGDLSNQLNARLKSLSDVDKALEYVYQRDNQHFTLLMLAALCGHDLVAEILLSYSSDVKKLLQLTGNIDDINGKRRSQVTALWCACDRSHYSLAKILIKIGGVNTNYFSRNPLLIDAVNNERLDTIQFLLENNYADIDETTENEYRKYNSLMLAAALGRIGMVTYLLKKNAKVDYVGGLNNGTALGCAAMQGHLDVVKLLHSSGASLNIKNSKNETPMLLAFTNGHIDVAEYLIDQTLNDVSIEELELMACSLVIPSRDSSSNSSLSVKMVDFLRTAFKIREIRNCPKIIMKPIIAYDFKRECQTVQELDKIQHDRHRLLIEGLIIRERILLPKKYKGLCAPLLTFGEQLIEKCEYERAIHLWEHTFHLYQNMNYETSLHRFVWIFCKMLDTNVSISPETFVRICRLTFQPSQQNHESHSIKNALCLVAIAGKILEVQTLTTSERQSIYQWISDLCHQQRRTLHGQTLLHLSVDEQTYLDINYRATEIRQILRFPNLTTTQLLLFHGIHWIDLDAADITNGDTVLHVISRSVEDDALCIVKLLLNARAHVDCRNKHDKTPLDYAKHPEIKLLLQKQQSPSTLKCLCAHYIVENLINYKLALHEASRLNIFIYLHGVLAKEHLTSINDKQ